MIKLATKIRLRLLMTGFATLFVSGMAHATCDYMIYSAPYYATSPGNYCVANNITFITSSNSTTSAVTISSSDVNLDFNGKTISGRWANNTPASGNEYGVTITGDPSNVVIGNGTLNGFRVGVAMWTNTGSNSANNITIENMTLNSMAGFGIQTGLNSVCNNCVIRNNVIMQTNASLCQNCGGWEGAVAVKMDYSDNLLLKDNTIIDLTSRGSLGSYGFYIKRSQNVTVDHNTVIDIIPSGNDTAIMGYLTPNYTVKNNTFMHFNRGIWYFYSSGVYSNSVYTNVQIPYTGGTDGGGNQ